MPHKLSCYKTVVGDYGFAFLKRLETILTNHNFNFKFKVAVGGYGFDHFKKNSKPWSLTIVLNLKLKS